MHSDLNRNNSVKIYLSPNLIFNKSLQFILLYLIDFTIKSSILKEYSKFVIFNFEY